MLKVLFSAATPSSILVKSATACFIREGKRTHLLFPTATINARYIRNMSTNSSNSSSSSADVSASSNLSEVRLFEPIAKEKPEIVYFGTHPFKPEELKGPNPMNPPIEREDKYYWLRDDTRSNEEVIKYLEDENSYCQQEMSKLTTLKDDLYQKLLSRLKETDDQVPCKKGPFLYYSRTIKGLSYPIHCRIPYVSDFVYVPSTESSAPYKDETIVLDENEVAKGHEYCAVSAVEESPDHSLVAFSVDNNGYETFTIRIRDIATGAFLDDVIEESDGTIVWGHDKSTLFYLTMDSEHRPNALWMHTLGQPQSSDIKFIEEPDERFWMGIGKSEDDKFLIVSIGSKETDEVHVLDISDSFSGAAALRCVRQRESGHRYNVYHHGSSFFIVTNKDGCKNNKLMTCSDDFSGEWTQVKEYNPNVFIEEITCFKNYLAVFGRENGFTQLWIISTSNLSEWRRIEWPESVSTVYEGDNYEFDTNVIRLTYSSLVTPQQVIDLNMSSGETKILKEKEVPGYDKSNYSYLRIEAPAADGKMIPMSLVFRKDAFPFTKPSPLLLYGYGSYGACMEPSFDMKRSVLLDRGIIYAIAHIRGGGELGRTWYEDEGKYLTKLNTFNDFGSCAKYLIGQGVTSADRMATVGRSAGGLLMGAMSFMYPSLFKCIVADVPFVDVVNTMSDPTIPLTVTEWEEWGNPNEEKFHNYMLSYSPYDNVSSDISYPAMLITAGLNDPRVAYWEPAKWVAKMRAIRRNKSAAGIALPPLLLKTDMSSGHFSASDRYKFLNETAFEYSFIVDQIVEGGK